MKFYKKNILNLLKNSVHSYIEETDINLVPPLGV
jgi:hypothetical protein